MAKRITRRPGRPPAKEGLARFVYALRELNVKVRKFKLQGRKHYYTYSEMQSVWARWEGKCADCGMLLSPTGTTTNSVRITHRVPLKRGGRIHKSNLIPLCEAHAAERDRPHTLPQLHVIDFNTFGDLIAQLVWSVLSKDETRTTYFKRVLDLTLAQFVQELHAIPIGAEAVLPEPIEHVTNVSLLVTDMITRLSSLFEEIGHSKHYQPIHAESKE